MVDPVTGALRIQYWWFYGYQHQCYAPIVGTTSNHDADWEHVMVTTSPDRSRVDRLTYYQHSGWYTRSATDGNDPEASIAGWLNLHTSSKQDDRPFPWYPSKSDPARRPMVYVDRVSHGAFHWSKSGDTFSCNYWGDASRPSASTKWNTSANLVLIDPGNADQTWMRAEAAENDPTMTFEHLGTPYTVDAWSWGWNDGGAAVGDGPIKSGFALDGSTLWDRANVSGSNGYSRACRQPPDKEVYDGIFWPASGSTPVCTKSHGWPAWVTLAAARRLVGTPGAEVGFDLTLDQVDLGGPTTQGQGTLTGASSVTLTATLTSGYAWSVSGGRNCAISSGNLLVCNIGGIGLVDPPLAVTVTAPSSGSPYDVGVDAQVTWRQKQQPVYLAAVRDGRDLGVTASGVGVSYARFYPYKDGYRDTVAIRGTPGEPLSVTVKVYNGSGKKVRSWTLATRSAPWSINWNGRNASGTRLPAGTYKVVQRLRDEIGHTKSYTSYTKISNKRLYWSKATITKYGSQLSMSSHPGTGKVSTAKSAYSRGVWLASGNESAAVRYTFTLRSAKVYGALKFKVLGRSPNGQKAHEGIWNRWNGSAKDVAAYDAKLIGPAYRWYSIAGGESANRDGQKAYGIVYVDYSGGVRKFDVSKVRLVYRYAILR